VSPPLIPDGRISRVRLAAAACPRRTFPGIPWFKRSSACTTWLRGYTSGSTHIEVATPDRLRVRGCFLCDARHLPRAPLPGVGAARSQGTPPIAALSGHYPAVIAHTDFHEEATSCQPVSHSILRMPPARDSAPREPLVRRGSAGPASTLNQRSTRLPFALLVSPVDWVHVGVRSVAGAAISWTGCIAPKPVIAVSRTGRWLFGEKAVTKILGQTRRS
jgi:hypothetical protein